MTQFGGGDGEDAEAWLQEFEYFAETTGWTEKEKVMAFRSRMKDKARVWLQSLPPNIGFGMMQLVANLRETFGGVHEHDEPFVELSKRTQKTGEAVDIYGYNLQRLAQRCKNVTDVQLRNYFLAGLLPELKMMVAVTRPETFIEALKTAKTVGRYLRMEKPNAKVATSELRRMEEEETPGKEEVQAMEEQQKPSSKQTQSTGNFGKGDIEGKLQDERWRDNGYQGTRGGYRGGYRGSFSQGYRGGQSFRGNNYRRNDNFQSNNGYRKDNGPRQGGFDNGRNANWRGKDANPNRTNIRNYRTVEGIVICRKCLKVGHMERSCTEKSQTVEPIKEEVKKA
jgi:hypothetical protein